MINTLQRYLAQVQEQLPFGGSRRARILSELETHLLEIWEDEQRRGIPPRKLSRSCWNALARPRPLAGNSPAWRWSAGCGRGDNAGSEPVCFWLRCLFVT